MYKIIKNKNGSALISVLIIVVLLSTLILGYLSIVTYQFKSNSRKAHQISLKWAANGAINKFINDILSYKTVVSDTIIEDQLNGCDYKIKLSKGDNNSFNITAVAKKQNLKYIITLPLSIAFLSEYLFYIKGDFNINPEFPKYDLYGPIFIENSLLIETVPDGEILFHINKRSSIPPITYGNDIAFINYRNLKSTINAGIGDTRDRIEDLAVIIRNGESMEIISEKYIKKDKTDFELPALETLFNNYQNKAYIHIKETDGFKTKKITNPYLLEKEVIGTGNGNGLTFPVKNKDRIIENIYFVKTKSLYEYIKVNPFSDIDTRNIQKHFKIKDQNLILDSDNEKYQLIIPEKELTTLNVFPYITDTVVYSAKDRKIKNVYLKNKLLYQGNDYEIDDKNSHIYFYSPDFTALAGKGNGYTREYTLQEKVNPLILFINRKRAYNFSIKDNRLVFDKPPEYGANIHYYRYIPEIHVTKPIPGYETAICIDKQIECIEINLNTINYPDNAVILSDVSLYIYGKSSKKIAFFVNDDVYLGYIKSNSSISIFSRLIWLDFKQKNEIDLDHVYLFSEAEALYPLNFNAESIKNIRGAMTFLCRYKPFTQKKSEIEKYYFYHDDKFFKGYFQYADEFLNSPPLCAPFKIIKQRSQDKN